MKPAAMLFGAALLSVSALPPAAISAQTVKPADLLGTWAAVPGEDPRFKNDTTLAKTTLTFRADSISERTDVMKDGKTRPSKGFWRMVGDTIWWGSPAAFPGTRVTLENQRLSVYHNSDWWPFKTGKKWEIREVYERVNAPTPPASGPPAAAQGGKTADLVGTWQGVPGEDRDLRTGGRHTLVLRSDSIYEETQADGTKNPAYTWKGYWRVSGDTLWFSNLAPESGLKAALEDKRLILSYWDPKVVGNHAVYQKQP